MSEGLPAGAVGLDPGDENTTTVGPVADPEATVTDPAVTEEAEPEGTVTTPTGEKMVPLSALKAERGQRKEAQKAVNELKPRAEEYDRVKGQVQAVMPLIQKVQARPDVLKMLDQPMQAPEAAKGPMSDSEAVEYAKDFDLYKADGSPDTDRAQRIVSRNLAVNARQTQHMIAPIMGNEAQRQSDKMFNHYAQMKLADGATVDPKILAEIWRNVPADQSANPAVANVLYLAALGEQVRQGKSPKPGPGPVLTTEGMGHKPAPAQSITQIDTSIMRAAGISEKQYAETAARFKPGQANSLE